MKSVMPYQNKEKDLWLVCTCDCYYCKLEGLHYLGICEPTNFGTGCKKW